MFTEKEIDIVVTLIEEEMSNSGHSGDSDAHELIAKYKGTLAGIEKKLKGAYSKQG
ncbi:MAG: hypothetical protein PHW46_01180 [Candidatus Omnitrophica bacterium]|nr:hypothetical protein [Candidatus Omnitrophota bacterium]